MVKLSPVGRTMQKSELAGFRIDKLTRERVAQGLNRAMTKGDAAAVALTVLYMWDRAAAERGLRTELLGGADLFEGEVVPAGFLDRLGVTLDADTMSVLAKLVDEEPERGLRHPTGELEAPQEATANSTTEPTSVGGPGTNVGPSEREEPRFDAFRTFRNVVERDRDRGGPEAAIGPVDSDPSMPAYPEQCAAAAERQGLHSAARSYWATASLLSIEMNDERGLDRTLPKAVVAGVRADDDRQIDDGDLDEVLSAAFVAGSASGRSSLLTLLMVAQREPGAALDRIGPRAREKLAGLVAEALPDLSMLIRRAKGQEPALAVASRRLGLIVDGLRRVSNSLLETPTLDEIRRKRAEIVASLRQLEPFVPGSEAPSHGRLVRALAGGIASYERAASAEIDVVYQDLRSEIDDALREARTNDGFYEGALFVPILSAIARAVETHFVGQVASRNPHLIVDVVKPALVTGSHWMFEVGVTNEGNGTARGISVEFESEDWYVAVPNRVVFDRLEPAATIVQKIEVLVSKTDEPRLILTIGVTYSGRRGESEERTELRVSKGRQSDFSLFEYDAPYTIQSIGSAERLKGRAEQLRRMRDAFRRRGSLWVTGQRRVGKTSLTKVFLAELDSVDRAVAIHVPLGEIEAASGEPDLGFLGRDLVARIREAFEMRFGYECPVAPPALSEFRDSFNAAFTGFIRQLDKAFPGLRLVLAIDDFDELPTPMFTGPQGRQLFLALRALMDKGTTFLFVGSERLPALMAEQAQRLNQVDVLLVDYLDAASLSALVRDPTAETLDFGDDAVDRIAAWSARNPYFATIICGEIFDRARLAEDPSISGLDVERAVAAIIDGTPRSFYQHFWADSPRVRDEERDLEETKAAIVVRSISRLQADPFQFIDRAVACRSARGLSGTEAEGELSSLLDRGVLELSSANDAFVRFRVPLFAGWLKRHADVQFKQDKSLAAQVRQFAPSNELGVDEVREIVNGLEYQGEPISTDDVRAWAQQFGSLDDQRVMLPLLAGVKALGLYRQAAFIGALTSIDALVGSASAKHGIPHLLDKKRRSENYFVTHVDETGKSGSVTVVAYRRHNKIYERHAGAPDKILPLLKEAPGPSILVCVDDFVGSGESAAHGLAALINRLDRDAVGWRDSTLLVYACVAGFRSGIERIQETVGDIVEVICPNPLDESDRAFSELGTIYKEGDDRLRALTLAERYGRLLDRRQPLGYEDSQALVVFPDSVPNNTLPIFWKTGNVGERLWTPLFKARG